MIKSIEVRVVEKTNKSNGNVFPVYSVREIDGTWVSAKFRKEVKNIPDEKGKYIFDIDTANMNATTNDYGKVWWISKVEDVREPEFVDTALDQF